MKRFLQRRKKLFSYVSGIGIGQYLDDYYVLEEAVEFKDGITVEGAYRNGKMLNVILKGDLGNKTISLKVKGKEYYPQQSSEVVTTMVSSNVSAEQNANDQMQLVFNSIPKHNDVMLMIDGKEYAIQLKQPRAYGEEYLYYANIGDYKLTTLPLSTNNDILAISYDLPKIGKVAWTPNLRGSTFIDESGEDYLVYHNAINPYEIIPLESNGEQMVKLSGSSIQVEKNFFDLIEDIKIKLPNPKDGEKIMLDQVFNIDGIDLMIHSIEREKNDIMVTINKDTSFTRLTNISFFAKLSNEHIGDNDEDYFYETAKNVITE